MQKIFLTFFQDSFSIITRQSIIYVAIFKTYVIFFHYFFFTTFQSLQLLQSVYFHNIAICMSDLFHVFTI